MADIATPHSTRTGPIAGKRRSPRLRQEARGQRHPAKRADERKRIGPEPAGGPDRDEQRREKQVYASPLESRSPPLDAPHRQGDQSPAHEKSATSGEPTGAGLRDTERQQWKKERARRPELLRRMIDPERQVRRDEERGGNECRDTDRLPRDRVPAEEDAEERHGEKRLCASTPRHIGSASASAPSASSPPNSGNRKGPYHPATAGSPAAASSYITAPATSRIGARASPDRASRGCRPGARPRHRRAGRPAGRSGPP